MDSLDKISIGQVVRSGAGRDKGNMFLIYSVLDDEFVYIVDGNVRKLDNPKKKKIKHLIVHKQVLCELKDKINNETEINNAYIRRLLEPFNRSF